MNKLKMMVAAFIAAVSVNVNADNWVLSLAGNGNTTLGSDGGTVVGADLGVGRTGKVLLPVEGGVRQGFGYATSTDDAVFNTKLYFDVFPVKFSRFEVGVGVNAGATYGNTPIVYSAAPEAVVRVWLTENAGVFARCEYPFDLGNQKLGDRLNYVIGLNIRF